MTDNTCTDARDSTQTAANRSQQVYQAIRGMMASGELPPGTRLKQLHLAKVLKTSQTPVRDAIRLLEQDGLAVSQANCGSVVRTFTAKDVEDIYELREQLDGFAARKVSEKADDESIAELRRMAIMADEIDQMNDSRAETRHSHDIAFHLKLIELGGNLQVLDVVRRLQDFQLFLVSRSNVEEHVARKRTSHIAIVTAIESRDEGWAEAVARRHIHNAFDILRQRPMDTWGRITEEGRSIPLQS